MKKQLILLLFVLQWLSFDAQAGILKGKITDDNGLALPFATVYISGTTNGVNANSDGEYQISLAPGTYKVICQYIGYKPNDFNVTIKADEVINHNFMLKGQSYEMKEAVVHANAEDPAYEYIRKAIARRKFHLQQVHSFQAGIYLKGVLRTRQTPGKLLGDKIDKSELGLDTAGKGILYLAEEQADYYAKGANKNKTIIHSVHQSGDPRGMGFAKIPSVITFYENNIAIFNPRGFVSPISDNALHYYKYKLLGEFSENGHTIYRISVKPKRLYEPLFTGTIYIVDEDWAIEGLSMLLTGKSNLNVFDTVRIDQLFLPLKKDTWVVKSQVLYVTAGILGFDVTGNIVTVYDKQKVNEPIADSLFENNIVSTYDKAANNKDSSYWTSSRPIPLESDEKHDYVIKDSIRLREQDPKYIDSMRKVGNRVTAGQIFIYGLEQTLKGNKDVIKTNSILSGIVNYNTIEGVNIAPKALWTHTIDSQKVIEIKIGVRYGFANTRFNTMVRTSYKQESKTWEGRTWTLGIEGGKYVFQFNPQNPIPELYNSISTLFYNQNYLKLYERWTAGLFVNRDYANGFNWSLHASWQRRNPLENTSFYTFAGGGKDKLTPNMPDLNPELTDNTSWEIHDAALVRIALSYKPGYTYIQGPEKKMPIGSRWPRFTLNYEKGIPNILNSKVDFDKWRFAIEQDVRLKLFGTLSYNVAAGGFLNSNYVSIPDMMHLNGNEMAAVPLGFYLHGFELAPYYKYSNTAPLYGELHIEYNLQGLLTNKIPVLRQAEWHAVTGTNTFYASADNYYTEVFVGIDNIGLKTIRGFRIDLVQSWDNYNHRNTAFRIGYQPKGLVRVNVNKDEW